MVEWLFRTSLGDLHALVFFSTASGTCRLTDAEFLFPLDGKLFPGPAVSLVNNLRNGFLRILLQSPRTQLAMGHSEITRVP